MPCHTQVREIRSPMKQSDKRVIGDFSYGPSELTLNLLSGGGGGDILLVCVASVSVGLGSKERRKNGVFSVFPARKNGESARARDPNNRKGRYIFRWEFFASEPRGKSC